MIGSFLTRGLVMAFGYAYPAYECYKTVERNKPEIEQLRFWCQYWILVAVLTVCERVGDAFVSWVPMYSEAKLAFFIYLWYPKTKGTTYVYHSFFRPYIAKHENDIDQNLLEMRTRAGDLVVLYWQRAASYGQTRVFDILQYIAAQSTPRPQSQAQQDSTRARQSHPSPNLQQPPSAPTRQPSTPSRRQAAAQPETEEPPSPSSSTSSSQQPTEVEEVAIPPKAPETASAPSEASNGQITRALSDCSASRSTPSEPKTMLQEASSSGNENADPKAKETPMEETMRVTRAGLRKSRSRGKSSR